MANGQVSMGTIPIPYGLFGHARAVTMRIGVCSFVGDLDPLDFDMVKDWVRQGESTRTQIRAARIGLAVPKK
jgi:hypothetical protein